MTRRGKWSSYALFDIHAWNINRGGIDMGNVGPSTIVAQATPKKRRLAAVWVRLALPAGEWWSSSFQCQMQRRGLWRAT